MRALRAALEKDDLPALERELTLGLRSVGVPSSTSSISSFA